MKQLILAILLVGTLSSFSQNINNSKTMNEYYKLWTKVDSLQLKSLPKSALVEVEKIYQLAKKQNNADQLAKAIIHRLKMVSWREEDAIVKNLMELEKDEKEASFPAKPILSSMIAEIYWQYYQMNRYEFGSRSQTINYKNDDIRTWDLRKIVEITTSKHLQALAEKEKLQNTPLEVYNELIHKGYNTRHLRPTLYDFVAHRAIDFFSSEEPTLARPADQFVLNDEKYLSDAENFSKIEIKTGDSLAFKYYAISIYRDLVKFHLNDKEPAALVELDLARLTFVNGQSAAANKEALYLDALQKLEQKVAENQVSTRVSYFIAQVYYQRGLKYKPTQSAQYKWELQKTVEICDKAITKFPSSEGAQDCRSLKTTILEKSFSFQTEETNIPNRYFKLKCSYKNLNKLYLRVFSTNAKELEVIQEKSDSYYKKNNDYKSYYEIFVDHFNKKTPLRSWNETLPTDGDYQSHGVELPVEGLPFGDYVIMTADNPEFSYNQHAVAYDLTTVTDISLIDKADSTNDHEFYLLSRTSGKPLAQAKMDVNVSYYDYSSYKNKNKFLGTFVSDNLGYIKVPASKEDRTLVLDIVYGEDHFYSGNKAIRSRSFYQNPKTTVQPPNENIKIQLFTDRSIYRPGQTIYFKGLQYVSNGKNAEVVAKSSVHVAFYDVNQQVIAEQDFITNEFGTFNGTFTAPSAGLLGQMKISANYDDEVYISVEEYKRPKFEVKFDPIKGSFRLEDEVVAKVVAKAYSGANIDNAQVKFRVVRQASFPYWWYWRYRYYPTSPAMEVINGVGKTNEKGDFEIKFKAIPDLTVPKESQPTFTYTVYADVTDLNGETRTGNTSVAVGYVALNVSTNLPEELQRSQKGEFDIVTTNLSGEFEPAEGTISIFALKTPNRVFRDRRWEKPDLQIMQKENHDKWFPYDEFADETNEATWDKTEKVFEKKFNTATAKKFLLEKLVNWKQGRYVIEISTKDKFGTSISEVKSFTVFESDSKQLAFPEEEKLRNLKSTGEPGEKAAFVFGTGYDDIHVLYEISQEGKLLSRKWLQLKNEQQKFEIPIEESYRGNIAYSFTFLKENRTYTQSRIITVPYTNKELDISFETFRNKLQPGEAEEWKLKIKGKTADKVMAEMVASLYDASLDAFRPHNWFLNIYQQYNGVRNWNTSNGGYGTTQFNLVSNGWNNHTSGSSRSYDYLNWFGYSFGGYYRSWYEDDLSFSMEGASMDEVQVTGGNKSRKDKKMASPKMALQSMGAIRSELSKEEADSFASSAPAEDGEMAEENKEEAPTSFEDVKVRTNFNETAFFYPALQTDESGNIVIKFTIPEALTRWKMLGFSHTKDMKFGLVQNELVTQKDLMVVPNVPRFFRENDKITFATKVTNLTDKEVNGKADLLLFDALTMKEITPKIMEAVHGKFNTIGERDFTAKAGESTLLEWNLMIPEGVEAITYRVVAKAGNFSDGEEMAIPVLTNRMLVTETMPMPIRSKQTKTYTLDKLANNKSTTLRNHRLTLEFTSQPAWYAIQALPYIMEYPYECAEQTFSRFYANSIASHIVNSDPKIKRVFDIWKTKQPDALLSNLEKNQELKNILLEETPWVRQAKDESEAKRRVAVLFDLNKMTSELDRALDKLVKMQKGGGAWPWFDGMPEDRYITQHIACGLGHLDHLGIRDVRDNAKVWNMTTSAIAYLDRRMVEDYEELKRLAKKGDIKLSDQHIWHNHIHYLYMRSFFKDVEIKKNHKEAFDYFFGQSKKYWTSFGRYTQGMMAIAQHRYGEVAVPQSIIKSIREHALVSEEMGMYWKENYGYYWYEAPIESQALMIELFAEVAKDTKAVDDLKVWLIKEKQTTQWKTTKATAEACYALLLQGTNWLASDDMVEITIGNTKLEPKKMDDVQVEAGTGYFKKAWSGAEITDNMGKVTLEKKDEGVSWGALYWQYFEQLDKITPAETPLKLKKELFLQQNTPTGPVITPVVEKTKLTPGDLLKVRIELRVDRNMEYVHMKDMRASGFEPTNVLSQYKYQDGLHYYESTRDAATNFFMGYLPKGTYVFEYPLRVSQKGDFSNGITTIQCMYAPEFSSHSEGIRVKVE